MKTIAILMILLATTAWAWEEELFPWGSSTCFNNERGEECFGYSYYKDGKWVAVKVGCEPCPRNPVYTTRMDHLEEIGQSELISILERVKFLYEHQNATEWCNMPRTTLDYRPCPGPLERDYQYKLYKDIDAMIKRLK